MAQRHLDRLSAADTSFLDHEDAATHMHIGGVARFEGPAPAYEQLLEHVGARLGLVPRYRQKLVRAPLGVGRPLWADDPHFNLAFHVRHVSLPEPGDDARLRALTGRAFSQQLDRAKPLWELLLVEGFEDGGFALVTKTHHAVVDGVSGVDLMSVLLDGSGGHGPDHRHVEPWVARPQPSGTELLAREALGEARAVAGLAAGAARTVLDPGRALGAARDTLGALGEGMWTSLNPAPATPLSAPVGPHRRVDWVHADLDELKRVKDAFGGTVNDVVLAVVTGGVARFLRSRGTRTDGLELRACVPVSVRSERQRGALGTRLAQLIAPLPVFIADPVARLRYVKNAMEGLKESRQALGARTIATLDAFAAPTVFAQASRLSLSPRLYNLLVTNVPGPQQARFLLGRRMRTVVPIGFLAPGRVLSLAVMSYGGAVSFGLIGDWDQLPDLDEVGAGLRAALDELVAVADGSPGDLRNGRPGTPVRRARG